MTIHISYRKRGYQVTGDIDAGCLTKFVKPNVLYPVSYTIKQDGTVDHTPTMLKGEDLTEPQIVKLFLDQLL